MLTMLALALGWPGAAHAATTVSGASDSSVPLVIEPDTDPIVQSGGQDLMFIQKLPASRTITRVTVGDVARDDTCTEDARVQLYVRESLDGGYENSQQIAESVELVSLGPALSRRTFIFRELRLRAGRGYAFRIVPRLGCQNVKHRSWAHNAATVNGGPELCAHAPYGKRVWHVQGQDDVPSGCVTVRSGDTGFAPSMPTGWLETRTIPSGWWIPVRNIPIDVGEQCAPRHPPGSSWGIDEIYWRPHPNPDEGHQEQLTCRFRQYAPLNQEVPHGLVLQRRRRARARQRPA